MTNDARLFGEMRIRELTEHKYEDETDGIVFENFVIKHLKSSFVNNTDVNIVHASKHDDHIWGTDFLLQLSQYDKPIRCDFTFNYNHKDHMPFESKNIMHLKYPNDYYDHDIHFGVRTGNKDHRFKTPVIVIGFNLTASQLRKEIFDLYNTDLPYSDAIDHLLHGESVIYDSKGDPCGSMPAINGLIQQVEDVYIELLSKQYSYLKLTPDEKKQITNIKQIKSVTSDLVNRPSSEIPNMIDEISHIRDFELSDDLENDADNFGFNE